MMMMFTMLIRFVMIILGMLLVLVMSGRNNLGTNSLSYSDFLILRTIFGDLDRSTSLKSLTMILTSRKIFEKHIWSSKKKFLINFLIFRVDLLIYLYFSLSFPLAVYQVSKSSPSVARSNKQKAYVLVCICATLPSWQLKSGSANVRFKVSKSAPINAFRLLAQLPHTPPFMCVYARCCNHISQKVSVRNSSFPTIHLQISNSLTVITHAYTYVCVLVAVASQKRMHQKEYVTCVAAVAAVSKQLWGSHFYRRSWIVYKIADSFYCPLIEYPHMQSFPKRFAYVCEFRKVVLDGRSGTAGNALCHGNTHTWLRGFKWVSHSLPPKSTQVHRKLVIWCEVHVLQASVATVASQATAIKTATATRT